MSDDNIEGALRILRKRRDLLVQGIIDAEKGQIVATSQREELAAFDAQIWEIVSKTPAHPTLGRTADEWLTTPWRESCRDFSARLYTVLLYMDEMLLIGDLLQLTDEVLRRRKNCGRATIRELDRVLAARGLRRGMLMPADWAERRAAALASLPASEG